MKFTATSTLRDGIDSYEAANLHDGKQTTSWVEGSQGSGIGESVLIEFNMTEREHQQDNPLGINGFSLINGLARSEKLYSGNGRVKTLAVFFNERKVATLSVEDTRRPQTLRLPDIDLSPGRTDVLRLRILEVYPGSKYEDTAISDIFFHGYGVH